jgi:large subunit ribosomal protein L32
VAVPKRKTSKERKRKRRTHQGIAMPNVPKQGKVRAESGRSSRFFCPDCNQPKEPHAICPNCGSYGGKQMVDVEH